MKHEATIYDCSSYLVLRRRYWSSVILGMTLGLGAFVVTSLVPWAPVVGPVTFLGFIPCVGFLVKAAITWVRILRWPCPRCSKSFVLAWYSSWPANQCKHCGLSMHSP